MSIETDVSLLTAATTALLNAVGAQQIKVDDSVVAFEAAITTVNEDLNKVDNTSDADKPISAATELSIATKQATLVSGDNISTINGVSILGGEPLVIARSPTSLASLPYEDRGSLTLDPVLPNLPYVVDDTIVVEGIGLLMWHSTREEPDDDETCFTTPSGQWLLSLPAYDLLAAWSLIETSILDDLVEDSGFINTQ